MTYARKQLISLSETPYYHVVSRCVRRAWLWGYDEYADRDYSHRKHWVLKRLGEQTEVFAIDVCAYAVMANHYHLVLHIDSATAAAWPADEVVRRWTTFFSLPSLIERWRQHAVSDPERLLAEATIETWRARLANISWFMRCLNEHLARRANLEDGCKGRFWEGRFRSQALLDEPGLLTAMVYVDLNPIRAGSAATPESSEFTSIRARIQACGGPGLRDPERHRVRLLPFQTPKIVPGLPFDLNAYLQLVDWSGRAIRPDKHGSIDTGLPPILGRLGIDPDAWQTIMRPRGNVFGRAIGRLGRLRQHAHALSQSWVRGLQLAARTYCP